MQNRDRSVIKHIYRYCREISAELDQIANDKDRFMANFCEEELQFENIDE